MVEAGAREDSGCSLHSWNGSEGNGSKTAIVSGHQQNRQGGKRKDNPSHPFEDYGARDFPFDAMVPISALKGDGVDMIAWTN